MTTIIKHTLTEEQIFNGVNQGYLIWELRNRYRGVFGWNGHVVILSDGPELKFTIDLDLTEQQKNHVIAFIEGITQKEENKTYPENHVLVTIHIAPDAMVDGLRNILTNAGSDLTFKFLPKSTGSYEEGNYDASQRYFFNRVPTASEETLIRNALKSVVDVEVYGKP